MKNLTHITLALAALAVSASCGDDQNTTDAAVHIDAPIDAPGFPAAPTLGAQIDRLGRPAVNTALNTALGLGLTAAEVTAKKDKYNQAAMPSAWLDLVLKTGTPDITTKLEFATNLAFFDALDTTTTTGCGNQALYNGMANGGGTATATSYHALATVLADDQLYVDTSKTSCLNYLSLELELVLGGSIVHTQCGGRTPSNDVIDTSYSMMAAGLSGFNGTTPMIGDGGVGKHADVDDATFPFLGAPH